MCSVNWRVFADHISIAFNRDESVNRQKAEVPTVFNDNNCQFIMPRDPQGNGSWLAVNEYGFAFFILNDYQGQLKTSSENLLSRGMIIRQLASCKTLSDVKDYIKQIELTKSQPFHLLMISHQQQLYWYFDGIKTCLQAKQAPEQLYSSGHVNAESIIKARTAFITGFKIESDEALITAHQSHQLEATKTGIISNNLEYKDLSYTLCMHRVDAKTQSLTHIKLGTEQVQLKYWDGQPCQTDQFSFTQLALLN